VNHGDHRDSAALAAGLVAHLDADPNGAVSRHFTALAAATGRKCAAVANLATAFPGFAGRPARAEHVRRALARCRLCQVLRVDDDLDDLDCDLFDDETADSSCQPAL
jgi:hypothetical protein